MKTAKRILLFFLSVLILASCSGCDAVLDKLDGMIAYYYTVEFSFTENSDKEKLERRLNAIDIQIVSEENGTYKLDASYVFPDDYFDFACKEHDSKLVYSNGDIVISASDITGIKCDDISLDVKISEDMYNSLEETVYSESIRVETADGSFLTEPYCYEDDGEYYLCVMVADSDNDFDTLNKAEMALFSLAISLTGETFGGEVTGNVTERDTN